MSLYALGEKLRAAALAGLQEQILALLQHGRRVRRDEIAGQIGASKKDVGEAVQLLTEAGRARSVVRGDQEVLVGGGEDVLSAHELARLAAGVERLAAALRKVGAKAGPRTLLREDVRALLDEIAPEAVDGRAPARPHHLEPTEAMVAATMRRLEDPTFKLVSIPEVVGALRHQLDPAEVHRALFALDAAGVIELRPEGGSEFLTPEDARLCPPGPRDTVFSRARLAEGP